MLGEWSDGITMPLVATPGRAALRGGGNDFSSNAGHMESSDRFKNLETIGRSHLVRLAKPKA